MARPEEELSASAPEAVEAGTPDGATRSLIRSAAEPTGSLSAEPSFAAPERAGEVGKLGRYRVLKKLGQGGMGAVYVGYDAVLDRKVALKVMLPQYAASADARERFLREARTAAMIRNDHVVTIFDVDEERGIPFIAMEYLHGYPLDQYLKTKGELPLAHVLRVARETALGLAAAHERGLIHRDIKPANLWLEAPKGRVKLLDFGLARAENDDAHLTNSGAVLGTPAYMSPEQARGDKVDSRTDLFSLGVLLYRLATGKMPFRGNSVMAILTSLAVDTPPPVRQLKPDVPEALEWLINGLLAKNPDERVQTAMEVVKVLREIEAPKGSGLLPVAVAAEAVPMAISVQESNPWESLDASSGSQPRVLASATEALPSASPRAERKKVARKSPMLPLLSGVGLLAIIAVLVAVVITIKTPKGALIIESDDPDIEVVVKKDGAVIIDKTKDREIELKVGNYTIELSEKKDGLRLETDKFEITRDGKTRVRVWLEKPRQSTVLPNSASADGERRVAEWVVRNGGQVGIAFEGDRSRGWHEIAETLPAEPFWVFGIGGFRTARLDDKGLDSVHELRRLESLSLSGQPITDKGLARFLASPGAAKLLTLEVWDSVGDVGLAPLSNLRQLSVISLRRAKITDKTAMLFRDLPLTSVNLSETSITSAGLAALMGKKLVILRLDGCSKVDDAGMTHIKDITTITELRLGNTAVSDAGLGRLAANADLETLVLNHSKVTETGMEHIAGFRKLTYLNLEGLPISNDGLTRLSSLSALRQLYLRGTKVTEDGAKKLAAALPRCQITWGNGQVIEPTVVLTSDRKAAEWVLGVGGTVQINGVEKDLRAASELPAEHFVLTSVNLKRNASVTDDSLALFKDCQYLTSLQLDGTGARAKGLQHLAGCKNLFSLFLNDTKAGDAELAVVKDCRNLLALYMNDGTVTDEGLAHLKDWTRLTQIGLYGAPVTEKGIAHLRGCKNLQSFNLNGTQMGDAVFETMKGYRWLYYLDVSRTRVSPAKAVEFAKLNPRCSILHGRTIKPTVVLDRDRLAAEWVLSVGGTVMVNGEEKEIKAEADLPKGLFKLTTANLNYNKTVTDPDLLYYFECPSLTRLYLGGTQVGGAGLTWLRRCPALSTLDLGGTQVGDAGLAILRNCPGLTSLYLGGTRVGNLGLSHLGHLKNLSELSIFGTAVDNVGLAHLRALPQLAVLDLRKTKVTAGAVAELQKALPKCKVNPPDPKAALDPDRKAAEWVVAVGGLVGINGNETAIRNAADLPEEKFVLTSVNFGYGNTKVTAEGLQVFKDCKDITFLKIDRAQVDDAGLANFSNCKKLATLHIAVTGITDDGLASFKDCKELVQLSLGGNRINGKGLQHFQDCKNLALLDVNSASAIEDAAFAAFKDCKKLTYLNLSFASGRGDAALLHFKDCKNLEQLAFAETQIGDVGLAPFKDCKSLRVLDVRKTRVSPGLIEEFRKALPKCDIRSDDPKK